jgi:hypothetical protein
VQPVEKQLLFPENAALAPHLDALMQTRLFHKKFRAMVFWILGVQPLQF